MGGRHGDLIACDSSVRCFILLFHDRFRSTSIPYGEIIDLGAIMKLAIKLTIINDPYSFQTAKEVIEELVWAANKLDFPVTVNLRKRKIIANPDACFATLLRNYNDSAEGETVE